MMTTPDTPSLYDRLVASGSTWLPVECQAYFYLPWCPLAGPVPALSAVVRKQAQGDTHCARCPAHGVPVWDPLHEDTHA